MDTDFKRMLTAILLCMLIMIGWQYYMRQIHGPQQPQPDQSAPAQPVQSVQPSSGPPVSPVVPAGTTGQAQHQPSLTSAGSGAWSLRKPSETQTQDLILGDLIKKPGGYKALIVIDPATAAIREVLLSEHKLKVTDEKTGYPLLTAALDQDNRPRHSLMLGKMKMIGRAQTFDLSRQCWQMTEDSIDPAGLVRKVSFSATIADEKNQPVLDIIKTFSYGPDNYALDFCVSLKNNSNLPLQVESLELLGPVGPLREDQRTDLRNVVAAYRDREGQFSVERELLTAIVSKPQDALLEKTAGANLLWFGAANKFFAAAVHPFLTDQGNRLLQCSQSRVRGEVLHSTSTTDTQSSSKTIGALVTLKTGTPLESQSETTLNFQVYLGPIDREIFDNDARFTDLHYEKLMSNRSCSWCAFDWLTYFIFKMMRGIYNIIGNYGLAIILLVLVVRLMLHPITKKSQVSMMKMQKMGPRAEEIKKKYAGNKQEIQKRTMELYKEQGATPILGCLPMMLQMPIWIALFTAVGYNVALRHQGLLPASWHWLNDLSAPDRLIPFSVFGITKAVQIPMLGTVDAFNLLPILLCIAMFLQTKLSPQANVSSANPQMAQQQKMMMYMFPAMMLIFFYTAPSGLNLYIMASTFGGIIEQYFIRKHLRQEDVLAAIGTSPATAKVSARVGPKKKKPKPPFKYM